MISLGRFLVWCALAAVPAAAHAQENIYSRTGVGEGDFANAAPAYPVSTYTPPRSQSWQPLMPQYGAPVQLAPTVAPQRAPGNVMAPNTQPYTYTTPTYVAPQPVAATAPVQQKPAYYQDRGFTFIPPVTSGGYGDIPTANNYPYNRYDGAVTDSHAQQQYHNDNVRRAYSWGVR